MVKSPFIWLGSGRARKRGVARRGLLLDTVAHAGLPVPDGAILLDELFRIYLREGVVEQVGDKVVVPDPVWLLEVLYRDVRFPRLKTTAEISAIPPENMKGRLPEKAVAVDVDLEDAGQVAAALRKVWSYPTASDDFRRDVLLIKQVQGQTTGTARLAPDSDSAGIRIHGGTEEEASLPVLSSWERPNPDQAPYARRLQMLLRGLQRTLGKGEWVVSWIDDGEICWVVQVD